MGRKRHTPEQAVRKVREGERVLSAGSDLAEVLRHLEITESTWHRWRRADAGMNAADVRRLKELEAENARLKKLLAEAELDKAMLKDLAEKMVTPDRRRVAVERLQERFGSRREGRVGWWGGTAPPSGAQGAARCRRSALRERLRDFARCHPRLGWRTAHTVAHREGLVTNAKRTRRLWRDEGLQRPPQRKAKRRRLTDGTAAQLRARRPNDVWALDFASTRPPICAATPKISPTSPKPAPS